MSPLSPIVVRGVSVARTSDYQFGQRCSDTFHISSRMVWELRLLIPTKQITVLEQIDQ